MTRVAVAAGSQLAADAGAAAAANGGNAVDAAIAASLASMSTEVGIIALGAGGYVTVAPPDGDAVVIDAYAEMPGRSASADHPGAGGHEVHLEYGGGVTTRVGHGSVATPGAIAGFGEASARYGAVAWSVLVDPALHWAERGFPLSSASGEYLTHAHDVVFGWHPESRAPLHRDDGTPRQVGETILVPGLAEALTVLAEEGPASFYTGTLGQRMADDIVANGGILGPDDLAAYETVVRPPLRTALGDWTLLTNPGPAIGGAAVAAFLALATDVGGWDADGVAGLAAALDAVVSYRRGQLDTATDRGPAVERFLELAAGGDPTRMLSSPSTIHVSAVDEHGLACSISTSSGYGSGAVVPGSGIWLNNSLGELELVGGTIGEVAPGTRLPSNMAPSIARRDDGAVLAIGSPGASRITSAVAEVVFNHLRLGMPLREAVAHPRLHVELFDGVPTVAHEPGIDVERVVGLTPRPFDAPSMYFGGTQVAAWDPEHGLDAVADPRRSGGVAYGG